MVVVPTDEHVELTYGREPVEWIGYALTLLGIGLAILLATRPPVRGPARRRSSDADEPIDGRGPWTPLGVEPAGASPSRRLDRHLAPP